MKNNLKLGLLFLAIVATSAFAQTAQKHPKVLEMERFLTTEAYNFIKSRFPNEPVMVETQVIPLRRDVRDTNLNGELMPYDMEQGFKDEWDDQYLTVHDLFSRIQSVTLRLVLPNKVSELEVAELKEGLYSNLKLVPGRDQINYERRSWAVKKDLTSTDLLIAAGIILLFIPVLFLSLQSAARKLAKGMKEISSNVAGGQSSSSSAPIQIPAQVKSEGSGGTMGGDVTFTDPIKVQEKIQPFINKLAEDPCFPNLEDMIGLDKFVEEDPSSAGAVLAEFPLKVRNRIFMLSSKTSWFEALTNPGTLKMSHFELVSKLAKRERDQNENSWQMMLITLWRLNDDLPKFLSSLPQDEATRILASMPSELSVPIGKIVMPGSWASLLSHDPDSQLLSGDRVREIGRKSLEFKELQDPKMLERYRHEKGILDYLRYANIRDETEVYEVAGPTSLLFQLRPPFYKVVQLRKEDLEEVANLFPIEQWSAAFFNVSREERGQFVEVLSDKQKILFIEGFKRMEVQANAKDLVADAREYIAQQIEAWRKQRDFAQVQESAVDEIPVVEQDIPDDIQAA